VWGLFCGVLGGDESSIRVLIVVITIPNISFSIYEAFVQTNTRAKTKCKSNCRAEIDQSQTAFQQGVFAQRISRNGKCAGPGRNAELRHAMHLCPRYLKTKNNTFIDEPSGCQNLIR
jgi:hypothetical protein